jgi:hypothetical protein
MTRPRYILMLVSLGLIVGLASAVGFGGWLENGTLYAGVEMTGDGYTLIGKAGQPAVGQASGDDWTLYGGSSPTVPEETCLGDLDGSGSVDITDLLAFLAVFGTPEADLNGDGLGDINDLLILLSQFGSACDGI